MTPTSELYNSIQMAYDHFNESLFVSAPSGTVNA